MGEASNPGPRHFLRRPSCDSALRTQVDSCSDTPLELLDAMEHDLTVEDGTTPVVSTGRFHVLSSEDFRRRTSDSLQSCGPTRERHAATKWVVADVGG